jgi:bifunctional non-homologous end joining protein LigD
MTGKGEALFNRICKEGGEGVIAKKAKRFLSRQPHRCWLKIKCIERQEFVIVGWMESDKRAGFRSLLLAAKDKGKLTYVGKVGTGFSTQMLHDLMDRMKPLEVDEPPVELPPAARKQAHFIEPELVADIAFAEFTSEGILRHPSFIALREDKPASEVVVEKPKALPKSAKKSARKTAKHRDHPTPESFGITISSPDRAIYPTEKLTKYQLAQYYAAIDPLIMADAANRPITLIRCPQGRAKKCFFQKHDTGSMGEQVKHVPIAEKKGGTKDYLYVEDISRNPRLRSDGDDRVPRLGKPGGQGRASRPAGIRPRPRRGARFRRGPRCGAPDPRPAGRHGAGNLPDADRRQGRPCGRPARPVRRLGGRHLFRRALRPAVAEAEPDRFTANMRKAQRKGRIFLDWLRNQRGSTAVLPYSARAREGAPVAAPIAWDELDDYEGGNAFTIRQTDLLFDRAESKLLKGWGQACPGRAVRR